MRRRIVTLAALTLSLSAIGIAPLTAQATSSQTVSGTTSITASLVNSVDVTIPGTLALGALDPETGVSNVDFTFGVAFNGTGYQVTFTSAHPSGSSGFQMAKGATTNYLPYTIVGNSTGDTASYVSGTHGTTLNDAIPHFKVSVAAPGTPSTAIPSGAYTDSLTVLVTAV